jgi:hypothetical protein
MLVPYHSPPGKPCANQPSNSGASLNCWSGPIGVAQTASRLFRRLPNLRIWMAVLLSLAGWAELGVENALALPQSAYWLAFFVLDFFPSLPLASARNREQFIDVQGRFSTFHMWENNTFTIHSLFSGCTFGLTERGSRSILTPLCSSLWVGSSVGRAAAF